MKTVAIVAGGPSQLIPNLGACEEVQTWIGADKGALTLIENGITPNIAIGDFDSLTEEQRHIVNQKSMCVDAHPIEKDATDLELAITKAIEKRPDQIYLFGVTGGRLDHGMSSVQLLYKLMDEKIIGVIIDKNNWIEMKVPGHHSIHRDPYYPNISFLPFSDKVIGITLEGFYYKLTNADISWGSTRCISNKLLSEIGTFSFKKGIVLVIKSRDVLI